MMIKPLLYFVNGGLILSIFLELVLIMIYGSVISYENNMFILSFEIFMTLAMTIINLVWGIRCQEEELKK